MEGCRVEPGDLGDGNLPAGSRDGEAQKLKYNVTFIPLKNRLTTRFCHVLLCIVSAILRYYCSLQETGVDYKVTFNTPLYEILGGYQEIKTGVSYERWGY